MNKRNAKASGIEPNATVHVVDSAREILPPEGVAETPASGLNNSGTRSELNTTVSPKGNRSAKGCTKEADHPPRCEGPSRPNDTLACDTTEKSKSHHGADTAANNIWTSKNCHIGKPCMKDGAEYASKAPKSNNKPIHIKDDEINATITNQFPKKNTFTKQYIRLKKETGQRRNITLRNANDVPITPL